MIRHLDHTIEEVRRFIRRGEISWAGNIRDQIYGTLSCRSGKRMKQRNRVFFKSEKEAMQAGYRPCGHCLRLQYAKWKNKE